MGSWGFVFWALVFLAGWMAGNRDVGFDRYPFILLNLILSCLAALQGAILLIAAKREDQIASELAHRDFETNVEAERVIRATHALVSEIRIVLEGLEARSVTDERPTSRRIVPDRDRPRRTR